MDEVKIDGQPVKSFEAGFAIGEDRPGATVRDPSAAGTGHAAFGDDPRAPIRATAAERLGDQSLVAARWRISGAVRVRGIKHGDARIGSSRDGVERGRVVSIGGRGETHAAKADAKLRAVEPSREVQGSERTARSGAL